MAYTVYMHVNKTNGKKYIGITCQKNLNVRWHNGEGYRQQRRFYNAIKCYGFDGFDHVVLETGLTKEQAETKEREYISKYKSNDLQYGYNIENGGRVNKYTDEQKEQRRRAQLGRKHSEASKKKMSVIMRGRSTEWLTGRKASETTRAKMSECRMGAKNSRAKKVIQYDLNGNYVASYEYMDLIKSALGIKSTSHISLCCNGKRNKAYGYVWKYATEGVS